MDGMIAPEVEREECRHGLACLGRAIDQNRHARAIRLAGKPHLDLPAISQSTEHLLGFFHHVKTQLGRPTGRAAVHVFLEQGQHLRATPGLPILHRLHSGAFLGGEQVRQGVVGHLGFIV